MYKRQHRPRAVDHEHRVVGRDLDHRLRRAVELVEREGAVVRVVVPVRLALRAVDRLLRGGVVGLRAGLPRRAIGREPQELVAPVELLALVRAGGHLQVALAAGDVLPLRVHPLDPGPQRLQVVAALLLRVRARLVQLLLAGLLELGLLLRQLLLLRRQVLLDLRELRRVGRRGLLLLEVRDRSMGEWQRAILLGFDVWRAVLKTGGGRILVDLDAKDLKYLGPPNKPGAKWARSALPSSHTALKRR